ncbi:MAG: HAMP domain-containing sensor histidine kinase [Acidobacteriota bacterium]
MRISVAFFAISLVVSGLFAVATFFSFEVVRPSYSDSQYDNDLDDFIESRGSTPRPGTWETPAYQAYVAELDDLSRLPVRLRGLEPGRHQIEHDSEPSEVQVEDRGQFRYLIEYDIEQILAIEGEITLVLIVLLGGGVLLSSLLALGFGYWMSSRIIQPLTRLARRVEALDAQPSRVLEEGAYGTDEVADLARAFERYWRRLVGFVEREKAFAADASHELRTGVASIASGVELLMTEAHGEPTRSRLARLQRASRHMSRLIEALLVLAREGDIEARPAAPRSAMGPALREIVNGRQQAASDREIGLTLDLARESDLAVPEEVLAIVVGNVIDNAIAYTPEGEIRVAQDGDRIEIVDNGPGIPEHELPFVYQRAFRGGRSPGGGAGLGLSIVKRLCEHNGWRIEIDSTTGVGTRVRIDLAPDPESP